MKVSELIANAIQAYGVKRVYGLIGTSVIELVDSLRDASIRYVSTRHEYGAVAMADGEARVTGKASVCIVHAGPGFLNSLTGLANSYKDSSPVVMFAGAVKRRLSGTNSWLEVDQLGIAEKLTKKCFRISRPGEAATILSGSFSASLSEPKGPVYVEVPEDVMRLDAGEKINELRIQKKQVGDDEVRKIIGLLINSRKPIILLGGGANNEDASMLLREIISRVRVPVITTGNGRGAVSEEDELCLGRVGFGGGNIVADNAFLDADLVLCIGSGLSDITTYGYNLMPRGKVVSVELNEEWQSKPVNYEMHVESDSVFFLEKLNSMLPGSYRCDEWLNQISEQKQRLEREVSSYLKKRKEGYVNPGLFLTEVDGLFKDYVLAVGQGFHTLYAYTFMKVRNPRSFLAATNMGSMGFAVPAAIGASLSTGKDVICVVGDGEFMMSVMELETAVREKAPVKIVVLNDSSYRVLLMRQKMQKMGRIHGTLHGNPSIVKLAQSFGLDAMSVNSEEQIDSALSFLKEKRSLPVIVELIVDRDDIPPFNIDASLLF